VQPTFSNAFSHALPADPSTDAGTRQVHHAVYAFVRPTPVTHPRLLLSSAETAGLLGLTSACLGGPAFTAVLAGNAIGAGSMPYATCYGGHQFGHWAGQLGDGRAINLGELGGYTLQLKGAGPTPFSRHADGRAVLRS
jgi:uncharacterized protein YdiU (UPF0061 family)